MLVQLIIQENQETGDINVVFTTEPLIEIEDYKVGVGSLAKSPVKKAFVTLVAHDPKGEELLKSLIDKTLKNDGFIDGEESILMEEKYLLNINQLYPDGYLTKVLDEHFQKELVNK